MTIFSLNHVLKGAIKTALTAAAAVTFGAFATEECASDREECVEVGVWNFSVGLGMGYHENPIIDGDNIPIVLLPSWSYYGERFFLTNFTAGFTFIDTEHHQLNLLATPSYDQMYFSDWGIGNFSLGSAADTLGDSGASSNFGEPIGAGGERENPPIDEQPTQMPADDGQGPDLVDESDIDTSDRKMTYYAGLEYSYRYQNFTAFVQALQDATDRHSGRELRAALSYDIPFERQRFSLTGGFTWQSDKVANYYYGVSEQDTRSESDFYSPGATVSPFVRLNWQVKLSQNWTWLNVVHYRPLDDKIVDSPIVDKGEIFTVFTGGVYHF